MNSLLQSLKQVSSLLLGGLAIVGVALVCAFLSLRIAIHGREVEVPNLAGLSDSDGAAAASDLGLNLSVENRFYSPTVPPNHILSQSPGPGSRVRRGWQVRITESLGPQRMSVPDVTGQTDRPASLILRRLQLEVGTVAHLPAPSPAGIVLAQSPPPNSIGLNGPLVSLLVSDEETEVADQAFVMPSLVGLTVGAATLRVAGAGLTISSTANADLPDNGEGERAITLSAPAGQAAIVSQSPLAGHRVTRSDTIHVTLSN